MLRDPETGLFRFWTHVNDPGDRPGPEAICFLYYESEDGLSWRRPNLGLFELDGDKAQNNIFISRKGGSR